MADNEVKFSLSAEATEMMNALQRVDQKMAEVIDNVKGLTKAQKGHTDETKNSENAVVSWGKQQVTQLASMAAGYLSIQAAISGVKRLYDEWHQSAVKTHEVTMTGMQDILSLAANAGDILKIPQLEAFVKKISETPGMKDLTVRDISAAYGGVRGARPDLTYEGVEKLTTEVLKAESAGYQDLGLVGKVAGEVGQLMPQLDEKGMVNYAAFLIGELGKSAQKLGGGGKSMLRGVHGLASQGVDPMQAFGMLKAAMEEEQGPAVLAQLSDAMSKDIDIVKRKFGGAELTPEQKALNELAAIPKGLPRLKKILSDSETSAALMGEGARDVMGMIRDADVAGFVKRGQEYVASSTLDKNAEFLRSTKTGRFLDTAEEGAARVEMARILKGLETGGADITTAEQALEEAFVTYRTPGWKKITRRAVSSAIGFLSGEEEMIKNLLWNPETRERGMELMERGGIKWGVDKDSPTSSANEIRGIWKEMSDKEKQLAETLGILDESFKRVVDALEKNSEVTEANTDGTPVGPNSGM